ncbi:MAG: single-stranded-DNA-specific exonuclease RecJ [Burkholderiales bacterium]|nr:single-stranded-DNA-specific exonuclease RecJ [Burkholderiales bacterium]
MSEARPRIVARPYAERASLTLAQAGIHPVLSRIYAARGVASAADLDHALAGLADPGLLTGADAAARLLADALARGARILIVADYDCDGATACAVAVRGLRALGAATGTTAAVDFLVPDRFTLGYGLTPEVVALACRHPRLGKPDIIVTVDNGIASLDGVAAANAQGIAVLVTDHHLPGEALPAAACIVNPNQPGCGFPSKHLAGVGVMFYVLLALRAELRRRGAFAGAEPNLGALLDLVALGTVADVVRLDRNNRLLVAQGLKRIRAGRASPGVAALLAVAGRSAARAGAFDLGFAAGPRLNAAGRLDDMTVGIACLLADDLPAAMGLAQRLDELNRERRDIEARMRDEALASLAVDDPGERFTIALFDPAWHQGVVGIVASRVKDRYHRPAVVFAPGAGDELRGSGRSIGALNLRDCLDLVSKAEPGLLRRFGGHAMAAGLTIAAADFARFAAAFEAAARRMLAPADLGATVLTDGALEPSYLNLPFARALEDEVWGQGFAAPTFADTFNIAAQRLVRERHLKLSLERGGRLLDAIQFNATERLPARARVAFRLGIDEYNGNARAGIFVEAWEAA